MKNLRSEKIGNMYDALQGQAVKLLFGDQPQLHWGYWDSSNINDSFADATHRLTEIMISKAKIQEGQLFCDIGCGLGIPAMKLADEKGCYVDGITISKYQQEVATLWAKEKGVSGKTNFFFGDALNTPFDDNTYDGGWFFESIFHMGHKEALYEAYRVLKSGSTLLLADFLALPTISEQFKKYAIEELYSDFISKEDYPSLAHDAGFEIVEFSDISENVIPLALQKARETFNKKMDGISKLSDSNVIERMLWRIEEISNNLGYVIVTVVKK